MAVTEEAFRDLRDYLCGLRGRTRVLVCKETGISYLTRTKDLRSSSQSGVVLVEETILYYLNRTKNLRLRGRHDVVLAETPVMHA
jgi:hypothetical protein